MPKISAYPDGVSIQNSDLFVLVRSGKNYRISGSVVKTAHLPFGTYLDLNPITGDKAPYALSYARNIEFVEIAAGVVLLGAAHSNSDYYTINVYHRATGLIGVDTLLASVNTKLCTTGGSSYVLTTTVFSPTTKTGPGLLYILTVKTGSPSDFYFYPPLFEVKFT